MNRFLLVAMIIVVAVVTIFGLGQYVARSEDGDAIMKVLPDAATLRHPRRGHSMTVIGSKMWITGGRSYQSHYGGWGKNGHEPYINYPNQEYLDLKTMKMVYTKIKGQKNAYKATAFVLPDKPTIIYLAGEKSLYKLDTVKEEMVAVKDFGIKGDFSAAGAGLMTIKGKQYMVLVGVEKIFFFDPETEKFVNIPGVSDKFPADGAACGLVKNKFYAFGGSPVGESSKDAWVFDPNAPLDQQLTKLPDLPVPLMGSKSVVYKNKIYMVSGDSGGDYLDSIIMYDPAKKTYSALHPIPRASSKHAVCLYKGKIYVTYGYAWGSVEEGKEGFRMHPALTLEYNIKADQPKPLDKDISALITSVKGDKMNVTLSFVDVNKITGPSQTLAVNWQASTAATKGVLYYRLKGQGDYTAVAANGTKYSVGLAGAQGFSAQMTNLKPDSLYEYYVVSEGKTQFKSEVFTFKTQPEKPNAVVFSVYGDSKAQYDVANELNGDILSKLRANGEQGIPGFNVMLGDFGSVGAIPEYNAWFNYGWKKQNSKELVASFPFYLSHGNHESLVGTYFNSFTYPTKGMDGWPELNNKGNEELWFSFNYGPAHIIALTSGYGGTEWDKRQLDWFKQDLAQAKLQKQAGKIKWIVVMQHHSMMSTGEHFADHDVYGYWLKGSYVDTINDSNAVDLVLGAHDHNYERSKNIRGIRWIKADSGNKFVKDPGAFIEESSGRFGTATKGKGTIWMTMGGAGAAQRECVPRSELGESSFIAWRKPDPDKGESAAINPVYCYGFFTISETELKIEVFEKNISYLPGSESGNFADDAFDGLLDSVVIK